MELGRAKPCDQPGSDGPRSQLTDWQVRTRSDHQVHARREGESLATNNLWSTKRALAAAAVRVSGCERRTTCAKRWGSLQSAPVGLTHVFPTGRRRRPNGLMAHPVRYENSPFRRGDEGSPETTPSSALTFYLVLEMSIRDCSYQLVPNIAVRVATHTGAQIFGRHDEQILLTSKQLTELWLLSMNCARSSAEVGSKQRVVSGAAGLNSMHLGVLQTIGCQPQRR